MERHWALGEDCYQLSDEFSDSMNTALSFSFPWMQRQDHLTEATSLCGLGVEGETMLFIDE
jgi:hypothetical protein